VLKWLKEFFSFKTNLGTNQKINELPSELRNQPPSDQDFLDLMLRSRSEAKRRKYLDELKKEVERHAPS